MLLLAGELDEIIVYDIKDKKQLQTFKAHEIRFCPCFTLPNIGSLCSTCECQSHIAAENELLSCCYSLYRLYL